MHQSPRDLVFPRSRLSWMTWHSNISQPEVFFDLVNQINARKTEREEFVDQIVAGSIDTYEECQYQM